MKRRWLFFVAIIVVLVIAAVRLAITPAFVSGYQVIDDYNLALQVTGATPTWRAITVQAETPSDVTIGISEMSLRFGAGFGDERIAYVVVTLTNPLGARRVLGAFNGVEIPRLQP
jgi:hypothetical protein